MGLGESRSLPYRRSQCLDLGGAISLHTPAAANVMTDDACSLDVVVVVDVVDVVVVVISSSLFTSVTVVVVVTFLFGSGVMFGTLLEHRFVVGVVRCRRYRRCRRGRRRRRVDGSIRQLLAVAVNRPRVVNVNVGNSGENTTYVSMSVSLLRLSSFFVVVVVVADVSMGCKAIVADEPTSMTLHFCLRTYFASATSEPTTSGPTTCQNPASMCFTMSLTVLATSTSAKSTTPPFPT